MAEALAGASLVLHAGDVGRDAILDALESIAPLHAIRGNVDRAGRVAELPATRSVEIEGRRLHLVHARADLDIDPRGAGVDVVVSGHSHRAVEEVLDGVLYLNPGSVGPRRFGLPITMAWLIFGAARLPTAEFVTFDA